MGNILKRLFKKNQEINDNFEKIPILDIRKDIDNINEKIEETLSFIEHVSNPQINELKKRVYELEVKNNFLNRELASIRYKISKDDDDFHSVSEN